MCDDVNVLMYFSRGIGGLWSGGGVRWIGVDMMWM